MTKTPILLYALWVILALRLTVAAIRHDSLRDDMLVLPAVSFLFVTFIAGRQLLSARRHDA